MHAPIPGESPEAASSSTSRSASSPRLTEKGRRGGKSKWYKSGEAPAPTPGEVAVVVGLKDIKLGVEMTKLRILEPVMMMRLVEMVRMMMIMIMMRGRGMILGNGRRRRMSRSEEGLRIRRRRSHSHQDHHAPSLSSSSIYTGNCISISDNYPHQCKLPSIRQSTTNYPQLVMVLLLLLVLVIPQPAYSDDGGGGGGPPGATERFTSNRTTNRDTIYYGSQQEIFSRQSSPSSSSTSSASSALNRIRLLLKSNYSDSGGGGGGGGGLTSSEGGGGVGGLGGLSGLHHHLTLLNSNSSHDRVFSSTSNKQPNSNSNNKLSSNNNSSGQTKLERRYKTSNAYHEKSKSARLQQLTKVIHQQEEESRDSGEQSASLRKLMNIQSTPPRVNRNIHTRNLISYGIVSGGTTDVLKSKDSIHIAGFFPTSSLRNISSEGAIGRGVLPAVKLAIYHINNNNETLPDYKLHISWNDTKCSASDGMKAFFDMMHETPLKYMLFGDACTQVTDPIAKASRYWKVAQLSYADMHPMFSKKNYPNLFRIVPSENEFNAPRLALLKKFNWTRVGTLYQNKPRYSLAHNKLVADLEHMGVDVVAAQSFADDITYHIHKLKEKDVRIILGNFNETWARRIFCEAYKEKLYGRKYQWLIVAAYTPTWWRKQDDVNCTVEEVETALKGALLMDLLPLSTSSNVTISGLTAEKYNEMYQVVKLNEYSRFHGYAYDGIWAIAMALHNMSQFYPDPAHRHRKDLLRTFEYRNDNWQQAFLKALEATSFTGVTGKVEFKDNGRKGTILIKQFRAFNTVNAEVKVGEFDGVSQTLSLLASKDKEIVWNGKNPPKDRTIEIIEHTRVNPTLFAFMTVASSVGIVLACFFLAINIKFRNQRYIKMSSPYLNNLIIIGCIFTYTSVIILGLDSKLTSVEAFPYICTARAWILMAGFTLAFGSMFSKTWRVHSIFTNVKLNKKVIKDMQLFIVVGILLAIDFAIMTSWHFLDPMHRSTKKLEAYTNPNNDDIQIIPENEYCKSTYMNYFVGSIYAYKGLLMLFGCFLAWETRNVSIPALNDSKYIGMSVYNSVMMCVLGAPLSHVLSDKHDASFLIISVFIIFCTTATLCLVFLPKIIELKRNPKGTVEKKLRTTIKPPSQTGRRPSATSMYDAELKTAKQENQKIRKQIREVDNEIQALAKILGDDAHDILHDAMHNLALPKSEVLKKEDTDVSSLYSLNSDGGEDVFIEDGTEGGGTPKKKYPGIASALAAAAGNLSTTTTAPWEQNNSNPAAVVAKTILINSSGSSTCPVKSSAPSDDDPADPQTRAQLSNSPSEEPVTIEEKSLPKICEEERSGGSGGVSPPQLQLTPQQQLALQTQQQRQQRSLSVVIMQPIQLLPKYLRLNKSDLDLTESAEPGVDIRDAHAQVHHEHIQQQGGAGGDARSTSEQVLVVKDLQTTPVSTTTQQEIWTMLQKDRRYMDRNIYVGEEEEEPPEASAAPVVQSSNKSNKRLKSPTVAKPISLLMTGEGDAMRLQLPKKKKKIKTEGAGAQDEEEEDDEFINGGGRSSATSPQPPIPTARKQSLQQAQQGQPHHHRRLSMQPYHHKQAPHHQQSLTPQIRTLSSSTTTLASTQPTQQSHAYAPIGYPATHFPFTSHSTHDPNTYSQTLTTTSSSRPISSAFTHHQHASTEEINRSHALLNAPHPHHHTQISNNLKNRSYSVPRRLDNSQLNLSEINLDVSLLPIFHKILSERSRSLREGSRGGASTSATTVGVTSGSGGDLQRTEQASGPVLPGGNLRRGNKKSNNLMLSCPNIMIKCDIVEYL